MPEGHILHRLARDMAELVGPVVSASSPQRRFAAEELDGHRLTGVQAYGKHLLLGFGNSKSVHVHLGMRGKWLRFSPVTGVSAGGRTPWLDRCGAARPEPDRGGGQRIPGGGVARYGNVADPSGSVGD